MNIETALFPRGASSCYLPNAPLNQHTPIRCKLFRTFCGHVCFTPVGIRRDSSLQRNCHSRNRRFSKLRAHQI